jgi:hypothetical protein
LTLRRSALLAALCAVVAVAVRLRAGQAAQPELPAAAPPATALPLLTPPELARAPDNTFLTFPEWFLVYSPEELADFLQDRNPSDFPFLGHLAQFWQAYRAIHSAMAERYPFNSEYHVMIWVIGVSTTVEYGVKWGYETIVGRVTEATRTQGMTQEDRLSADVARRYLEFIRAEPWYRFDYLKPLAELWQTDLWGPSPLRKWERKYFLTTEFLLKFAYAWVIKQGSESAYGVESTVTTVVLSDGMPDSLDKLPNIKVVERHGNNVVMAQVPRYQAFTTEAQLLSALGFNFVEIAGNSDVIMVSAIVPSGFDASGLRCMLRQPILTRPGRERILFTVPVAELAATLRTIDRPPFVLEHIYDF